MKKLILLFSFIAIALTVFGQEEEEYELIPINWFLRVSPGVFAINSTPATIDLEFWDDDFVQPDSGFVSLETNSMWSYGFSGEVSYLLKKNFTVTHNAFIGLGANNTWNYIGQLSFGREFVFNNLYIQPRLGFSYIHNNLRLGEFYSNNKAYFQINDRFIYDDMKVRLKSRAFAVSPSVLIEYPINQYLSVFGKASGFFTFGRRSFLTFTGITDEYDNEGDAITAHENRNFDDFNVYFAINQRQIFSRKSPYLHYNFNSLFIEIGMGVRLAVPPY